MEPYSVRVPATTANLGPGYDAFGLALGLYNRFAAEPATEWRVEVSGEGADTLRTDAGNQVARAMARGFAEAGEPDRVAHVRCENRIPTGRGLGSSAAAIVGGLALADGMLGGVLGRQRVFELAVELEGHPDNVAAATFGGFTIGWSSDRPQAATIDPACGLAAVVVIADWELPTVAARGLLPAQVPHADAAFNVGRAGMLAAGVALGRADLVRDGLADRLHQQYRAAAIPDFDVVADALLRAGALGVALSGAGPTVIGLVLGVDDEAAYAAAVQVAESAAADLADVEGRIAPLALMLDRAGVTEF